MYFPWIDFYPYLHKYIENVLLQNALAFAIVW